MTTAMTTRRTPRRTSPRGAATVLVLALGALLVGGPALADDAPGRIAHVETDDAGLQILVDVPAGADVDLSSPTVTVAGQPTTATAKPVVGSDSTIRRTTVLVVDTSNSMRGARFAAAKTAARSFLRSVPEDVFVGIVGFAGDVQTLLQPTTDRRAALDVLGDLTLSQETHLYDGVIAAEDMAGDEGQRTLLVISDGADTSDTPLDVAVLAITGTDGDGPTVDVVALDQGGATVPGLAELAEAGRGQVIPADPVALDSAFAAEAATLANQVLVTAEVPAAVRDQGTTEGNVQVVLATSTGTVTAAAYSAFGAAQDAAAPVPVVGGADGMVLPGWIKYAGPAVLGVGLLVLLAMLVPSPPAPLTAEQRVTRYTGIKSRADGPRLEADQALNQARDVAADLLERNKGLEVRISRRLEAAGSELRPAEWLLVHGGVFIASGLLGLLLSRGNIVIGLLFLVLGFFLPWLYLGLRRSRRRKAFNGGLPDTLQLMSGSLSAGLSLAQSVDTIVREGPEPIAGEFKRVLVETRLGVSLEDAMDGISERFESKDFEWVVMAIRIQRQVGGNLAELLETVAATMREREYIRRQVAALAAEGKLSAYVLGGLPPMFLLYLLLANRTYVMPLFTEPMGWAMLAGASLILSVGVFWMSRLIKVEV